MRIAFVPIDNRPVCYTLPELISKIDSNFELLLPPRNLLGGLTKQADIRLLYEWLENIQDINGMVLSLDTLTYGGLIPSRRCPETLEQIMSRLDKLKKILLSKKCKINAVTSIMRISNNNYNEEEKEYWNKYGKKIFEYSYNFDKNGKANTADIPDEILKDYLDTRKRNFAINKIFLEWQKEGLFDTLVFSKDDCAEFGLNVAESHEIESAGGNTKTGADEIPLGLLSRMVSGNVKVCPVFLEPDYKTLISNYEDVSIENSVKGQLELANCEITDRNNADILLFVNNFKIRQGEIVMKIDTENFGGKFEVPDYPYMIADVRFANGSDNSFVKALFENKIVDENFYGYSAWNTSANSLGSLIFGAKMKFNAVKNSGYNKSGFAKLQILRFLDDWAYQANIRQELSSPDIEILTEKMKPYEKVVKSIIPSNAGIKYKFPWNRLFEVEIEYI